MKKLLYSLAAIVTISLISCSTGTEDLPGNSSIESIVTKGSWTVNLYMNANQDQTNDYTGYSFVFEKGGKVTATENGNVNIGTWSENTFSGQLILSFHTNNTALNNINDQWSIRNITDKSVNCNNISLGSNEVLGITQQ